METIDIDGHVPLATPVSQHISKHGCTETNKVAVMNVLLIKLLVGRSALRWCRFWPLNQWPVVLDT